MFADLGIEPHDVCRVVLGAIFLHSGSMKLRHPRSFRAALLTFSIGSRIRTMILRGVPPAEVLLGTLLLLNLCTRPGCLDYSIPSGRIYGWTLAIQAGRIN